ncbi:MAG TPA: Ig-like domain-containing protein, partial [Candidatus Binatia bacterium]
TGADLPAWSRLPATIVCAPYPSGALIGERDAHNGTIIVPPDERSGVAPSDIAAFRWSGSSFDEIPVQVDEVMPYCLSNINSSFGIYSGTDKEMTYAWDVESWKKTAGTCTTDYPPGETATPDPVPTLDDDDEIVFMASDAGPAAPAGVSMPPDVQDSVAVAVIDPLAPTTPKFVYLALRSGGSSFHADNGMVSYQRDANADQWIDRYFFADDDPQKIGTSNTGYGPNLSGPVCDPNTGERLSTDRFPRDGVTVSTASYQWRATGRWLVREMHVAKPDQPGVYGADLIDRWKGRAFQQSPDSTISVVGFEDEQVNWEANSSLLGEKTGPVRAIREVWGADSGTNVTKTESFYRDAITYRYHVRVHPIPPDGLYTSWDYNAGVAAKYYNTLKPDGVDIDGVNDDTGNIDAIDGMPAFFDIPDPSFNVPSAILNWEEVSGVADTGSLVYIIELKGATSLVNSAVVPYYRDDACLDDGTGDDPVQRPWPGESSTDPRVTAGYSAENGGTPYDQLTCRQRQGAWGTHGVHYFVTGDSDNLFSPEPTDEIDAMQWQFAAPTSQPTNVGERYANNVRIPLQVVAVPMKSLPAGAPPQASSSSATVVENGSVGVTLSGADYDTCELTFRIVTAPASGQLGAISDSACTPGMPDTDTATVVYTPNPGFTGSDSFTYAVSDGTTESQPATVTISVTPPPPPCSSGPRSDCRGSVAAGKGQLSLADEDDNSQDSLAWKWSAGEQTTIADFGDPANATSYELCVYDSTNTAIAAVVYAPADDCGSKSCWRAAKTGYSYNHHVDSSDGTTSSARLLLRAGDDGKAKITASATAGLLHIGGLPAKEPLVVQLRASGGNCWQSTFSAPAKASDPHTFEGRAD